MNGDEIIGLLADKTDLAWVLKETDINRRHFKHLSRTPIGSTATGFTDTDLAGTDLNRELTL